MTDELKPCPFCGAELKARTAVQYPKMALARIHPGSVEDGTCPIAGWGFYDEQLETWNTRAEDTALQQRVRELEDSLSFIAKWVERGLFCKTTSPQDAISLIAHYPGMPWRSQRWDVDHKPYAEAFYKAFPGAKGDTHD